MDEIERELGMEVVPFTWPVGMGKALPRRDGPAREADAGVQARRGPRPATTTRSSPASTTRPTPSASACSTSRPRARSSCCATPRRRSTARPSSPASQTPMFFGSAVNNFGVREVLDALVDLAPPPGRSRGDAARRRSPDEPKFSGVVFKIQANMDPAHRDRIAFVRVASGHFERGMRLKVVRSGKELRPNTVVSFLSQRRELLDEAFAGDIIGIPNHGVLQLGDTLTEGEALQYTGLPFFAPEMFRTVEVADPLRTKQLRAGLTQLGEEGAIQVFRPVAGTVLLLGAVGQLQFEVVAHRLEHEYGVKARILPARYNVARWVTCDEADGGAEGAAALHRRQRPPRRPRRGRRALRPARIRRRAAGDAGELAEDPLPRPARARRAGVPEAARGLTRTRRARRRVLPCSGSLRIRAATLRCRGRVARCALWPCALGVPLALVPLRALSWPCVVTACSSPGARAGSVRAPTRRGRSRPAGCRRCSGRSTGASSAGAPAARRGRSARAGRPRGWRSMITGCGRTKRRRRDVADRDAAVDARLVDADRDAGLGECRTGDSRRRAQKRESSS